MKPITRLAAILLVSTSLGCDTSVDLLTEDGRQLYALHGYLDSRADTQTVRIEPLRALVGASNASVDGVTVRAIDERTLREVLYVHEPTLTVSGATAHVYRAPLRPEPGSTWRLLVERNGVAGAEAVVRLPAAADLEVPPPDFGDGTFVTQELIFRRAGGSPQGVSLVYYAQAPGSEDVRRIEIPYAETPPVQGDVFRIQVYVSRDRVELLHGLDQPLDVQGVRLVGVAVQYALLSPEWSDREPDPGMVKGHGFFAARATFETTWRLSPEAVRLLSFVDAQ